MWELEKPDVTEVKLQERGWQETVTANQEYLEMTAQTPYDPQDLEQVRIILHYNDEKVELANDRLGHGFTVNFEAFHKPPTPEEVSYWLGIYTQTWKTSQLTQEQLNIHMQELIEFGSDLDVSLDNLLEELK